MTMRKLENGMRMIRIAGPGLVKYLGTKKGDTIEYDGKPYEVVEFHEEPRRGPDKWLMEFVLKPKGE